MDAVERIAPEEQQDQSVAPDSSEAVDKGTFDPGPPAATYLMLLQLTRLNCSSNLLTMVPEEIGYCTLLEELDLS